MLEPTDDQVVFRVSRTHYLKLSSLRYFTFLILGVALLWPWNLFLSASGYYGDRFHDSASIASTYSSTMMSISTITLAGLNYYLSRSQRDVDYSKRLKSGLWATVVIFVFMAMLCVSYALRSMKTHLFFFLLMLMVFASSIATCLAQNGTMAAANVSGPIYANAVMVGQAVAGVLASAALIISILIVGGTRIASQPVAEKNLGVAIYYASASVISAIALLLHYWCSRYIPPKSTQYQRLPTTGQRPASSDIDVQSLASNEVNENRTGANYPVTSSDETESGAVPLSVLWQKLKLIVLAIFFTFAITLVFPVFASIIESTHVESHNVLLQRSIYIPLVYLIWNLGDLLGRVLCAVPLLRMLITSPRTMLIYSISRSVFIILFLTCNIHPGDPLRPALFRSDVWYLVLQLLFGILNGQLCTSCFMNVAECCDGDDEKKAAAAFTSLFLSFGLAAGSLLSYAVVFLVR